MKPFNNAGFTIIETMLFLGVSALLITGVLVGTGTSINNQRYRDSVTSLRSFLQQQYAEVSNVSNQNLKNACYGDSTTNIPRGQSKCVILGRYVTTSLSSNSLSSQMVIGFKSSALPYTTEINAIEQYDIHVVSIADITYEIDWGASLVDKSNNPMKLSLLIIRSPSNGVIRTFIDNTQVVANIQDLLTSVQLDTDATLCVEPNGLFAGSGKMAVYVQKNANSASDVDTLGDKNSGCM